MDKYITKDFQETQNLGKKLAQEILERGVQSSAVVLALHGDLGAGKTTFLQGLAQGLKITEVVNSPTFVIMKKFRISDNNFEYFYHFDLYRLENEKDLEFLELEELLQDPKNIIAIEWPERMKSLPNKNTITIESKHLGDNQRELTIKK